MSIVCDSREITKFGFSQENTGYKKILFLGTHITKPSLDAGFYYFGVSNSFWSFIETVYQSADLSQAIADYRKSVKNAKRGTRNCPNRREAVIERTQAARNNLIACLQRHGIVINDVIGWCECDGPSDDQIIEAKPNDGQDGFHDVPSLMREADLIVVNGKGLDGEEIKPNSVRDFIRRFKFDTIVAPSKIVYVYGSTWGSPGIDVKKKDWIDSIGNVKQ